ncbi:hypothetical protein FOA52_011603 [Chlamydomonas sp. UWO 241]|nr:hypothetical protein FOA52_011603 [Chlamydomonas sp. UWO 241]
MWSLDLREGAGGKKRQWQEVATTGAVPRPGYSAATPGHGSVTWGDQMWLYANANASSSAPGDAALWRFDFVSHSWAAVDMSGCLPDRRLSASGYEGFGAVVTYGPYMLTFGAEQSIGVEQRDENCTPSPAAVQQSSGGTDAAAKRGRQLMLHAFDFVSGVWSWVPTSGSPAFIRCCAMAVIEQRLVAVGFSLSGGFQVSCLELSDHAEGMLAWQDIGTSGADGPPQPQDWAWRSEMVDGFVLLHGTCRVVRTAADAATGWWALEVATWEWSRVKVAPSECGSAGAGGSSSASAARFGHGLFYDAARKAVILVGGCTSLNAVADVTATEALQLQLEASPVKSAGAPRKAPLNNLPLVQRLRLDPCADLRPYCKNALMSDVTLLVDSHSYPAHRVVLAASSPRFRDALRPMELQQHGPRFEVSIVDAQPEVVELMLQFMYGCLDAVPPQSAQLLFAAADRYGLARLREACASILMEDIMSAESVTGCVLLAEQHGHSALMEACVAFAGISHPQLQDVLSSPNYLTLCAADPGLAQHFVKASLEQLMVRASQPSLAFTPV